MSPYGDSTGRYASPSSSSAEIVAQTPALPPPVSRRAVEPRLVAGLAAPRHRVERPEQLARHDVEAADVADDVVRLVRRARAACARRGTMMTSLAIVGGEFVPICVRVPVVALIERCLEIDDAVVAEALDRPARRRVQRDELIARRHVDARACRRRVCQNASPRPDSLPRRFGAARAFVQAVDPELLAGRGVRAPSRRGACRPSCTARRRRRAACSGSAYSGVGPKFATLKRHATSSEPKLLASI